MRYAIRSGLDLVPCPDVDVQLPVARKKHDCVTCRRAIEAGECYARVLGLLDHFGAAHHVDCALAMGWLLIRPEGYDTSEPFNLSLSAVQHAQATYARRDVELREALARNTRAAQAARAWIELRQTRLDARAAALRAFEQEGARARHRRRSSVEATRSASASFRLVARDRRQAILNADPMTTNLY